MMGVVVVKLSSLGVVITNLEEWLIITFVLLTGKVSFNIASEASYVYILSGQKLIKIAKNSQFGEFLKNCQTVLPDRSDLIGQKIGRKSQN